MSITVSWGNESKTVLKRTHRGLYSLAEYCDAIDHSARMLASVPHIVDIILEFHDYVAKREPGFLSKTVTYANKMRQPNEGQVVIVMHADFWAQVNFKLVTSIVNRAAENYHMAESIDEAYEILARHSRERVVAASPQ